MTRRNNKVADEMSGIVIKYAQEFAENAYIKYKEKDVVVVAANINVFPSFLDPVTQLQVNLNALKCIIMEIEGKEDVKEQDRKSNLIE